MIRILVADDVRILREVKSAQTLALAASGDPIRSRHGLTFLPRADLDAAGRVDRLLVPGVGPAPEAADAASRGPGAPWRPALDPLFLCLLGLSAVSAPRGWCGGSAPASPEPTHQNGGVMFPTDPSGLPEAARPALLELTDGDTLDLRIGPVAKRLRDTTVRMLGYNGSVPGPTLEVPQGAEIIVNVTNHGDLDTTVHWHGLRLENKYDGVPHETQTPIPIDGSFTYRLQFPDPGLYWYHPHIREDYTQELGLYGNILVVPAEPAYWPPVNREVLLTLDDILIEDGWIAPFSATETTYTAMGRYGNLLMVSGEPDLRLTAKAGEVVRLWLTNTANTRVFNVRLPGARMKLVGGDSGRIERQELVDEVLLAPSERAVVDVRFDQPGELTLEHRTPDRTYQLATVTVAGDPATPSFAAEFDALRGAPELEAERRQLDRWMAAPPDKTLSLVAEMDDLSTPHGGDGPLGYACPMHPEVTSQHPGRCPSAA